MNREPLSSYKDPRQLLNLAAGAPRALGWYFKGKIRALRVGDVILKTPFDREGRLNELVEEFRKLGIRNLPSGYGDVYHRIFDHAPTPSWVNEHLRLPPLGAWFEKKWSNAIGQWYEYDISSAYAWAATFGSGLPETRTACPSHRVERGGVYRLTFSGCGSRSVPPNLLAQTEVVLTSEEVERYDLRGVKVVAGVVFRKTVSIEENLEFIKKRFSGWKRIFRTYWGAWLSRTPISCSILRYGVPTKSWRVPSRRFSIPWSSFILSRPKMRVSEYAGDSILTHTDSVTIPYRITESGGGVGEWRLKAVVRNPSFAPPETQKAC